METRPMYSNVDNFAWWLKRQLEDRNITTVRLSKLSGVHPNTIRNYLSGRCEPTFYNVRCIVNALGYRLEAVKK